ncbi:Hypothetical protein CINCED_3A023895 [Cinara cedri]|uniref:Uncharacterized protein n=1 Tax=Cinara cedri TaxID=506608 RepID=A0A5E4N5R3_9HEMI|nr:Hypothetical protein CINCED_3A023895 [Cinara cedri]
MHAIETNNFPLKSRNSFLKKTKCLTKIKEQERVMQWTNQIRDKIWVPIVVLLSGNQLEWPIWRTLNRMRTGVERTKDNMKKWGLLEVKTTTCECKMEQSMKHIMQCPICPYS